MDKLLISTGGVIGIVAAVVAALAAVAVAALLLLGKNRGGVKGKIKADVIEINAENAKLLEVIDVTGKYKSATVAIVPPTHSALVIKNGAIADVCSGGEIQLYKENKTDKVHSLKIIYISNTVKLPVKWGTKPENRIEYFEPKLRKPVSVGAFGVMDVRVCEARKFYLELVASCQVFSDENLKERVGTRVVDDVVRAIGRVLNDEKLAYVDFTSAKYDVQSKVGDLLSERFSGYFGLEVCDFIIQNINVSSEQEEEIKSLYDEDGAYERDAVRFDRSEEAAARLRRAERTRKKELIEDGDTDDFLYKRERDRAREENEYARRMRHEDEDREWAREDKLTDKAQSLDYKTLDVYKDVEISRSEATAAGAKSSADALKNAGRHCGVCGSVYSPGAKYCPGCGAVVANGNEKKKCPSCGAEIPWETAFCPYCGQNTVNKR